jgi:hypothetical protein
MVYHLRMLSTRHCRVITRAAILPVTLLLTSTVLVGCVATSPDAGPGTMTFTRYDGKNGHLVVSNSAPEDEVEVTSAAGVQAHSITSHPLTSRGADMGQAQQLKIVDKMLDSMTINGSYKRAARPIS